MNHDHDWQLGYPWRRNKKESLHDGCWLLEIWSAMVNRSSRWAMSGLYIQTPMEDASEDCTLSRSPFSSYTWHTHLWESYTRCGRICGPAGIYDGRRPVNLDRFQCREFFCASKIMDPWFVGFGFLSSKKDTENENLDVSARSDNSQVQHAQAQSSKMHPRTAKHGSTFYG